MFLREVLLGTREQGGLEHTGNRWTLVGNPRLSHRLGDLVAARLEGVGDAAGRGLVALTLVEPLGYRVMRQLVADDALEQLERSGVIEVVHDVRRRQVRFAQPLYGEVVRARASHARILAVAEELIGLLGGDGAGAPAAVGTARRRGDALLLAELWRHAERPQGAAVFLAGAREAIGLGAHGRAAGLAELAVDRDGGFPALLAHGEALTYLSRAEQAEQVLTRAAAAAACEDEVASAALLRFHNQLFNRRDPLEADRIVAAARQQVADRDSQDRLDAALAMSATLRGDLRKALADSAGVLEREGAEASTLLGVLVLSSLCRVLLGDVGDARRHTRRAVPLLGPMREALPLAADQIGITEVLVHWHDAGADDAIARARQGHASSLEQDADAHTGAWAATLGSVLADVGRFSEADQRCQEAIARLESGDPLGVRGTALAVRARCAVALGQLATARSLLAEIAAQNGQDLRSSVHAGRAEVWLIAADGEVGRAAELALASGQRAIATSHLVWGAMLLHDAVRLGYPSAAVELLGSLAAQHDAGLLKLQARHATALAAADPSALHEVATAFADRGFLLYAAESMAQAAALLQRQGHTTAARRATSVAASLAEQTDAAATPALLRTPDPLTVREREVALLARHGAASRQIAAQLGLSVRTVDNYLASIYRKTGIEGRHQLDLVLSGTPAA